MIIARSLKGKICITFFVAKFLHGWIHNKQGIIKWQLKNIWKIADKGLIFLIYAESKVKIREEDEKPNRRESWSKPGYREIQITQKKKITKSQEEMWNLIGNKKKNANQNNNGIQFLTM